jgi:hypothetical protein
MNLTFSILSIDNEVIDTHNIEVYNDDSIEQIKYKLSNVIINKNIKCYYFFYKIKKEINPYDIYNTLSLNDTILIDKKKMSIFCENHNIKNINEKSFYNLEDVLELLQNTEYLINTPIGIENNNFIINPFKNTYSYTFNASTSANNLLLDYNLIDNIYVCFAEDILTYSNNLNLEPENVFNIYLPFLFQEKLFNLKNIPNINYENYDNYNNLIDLHYKINKENEDLNTNRMGIYSIYFVLYTKEFFNFPIDIFFKLLQSTSEYPYIKLNPGKKQENIYRLYAPYVNLSGNKAPYYDRSKLYKFKNIIKKNEALSYVIEYNKYRIVIDIDTNGYIYYSISELNLLSNDELNEIITNTLNPLINKLIHFFDPSEKIFNKFVSIDQDVVDIIDMKVKYLFDKTKINIRKNINCFSPIFNLIDERGPIVLRYKRVSNFNKTDSEQAYLLDLMNLQLPKETIISYFASAFNDTLDEAERKLEDIIYLYETKSNLNQRKIKKSKINPGFLVEIIYKDTNTEVIVNNITNSGYINNINIFINNLILISQKKINGDAINKYCKQISDIEIKEIESEVVNNNQVEQFSENANVNFNFELNFGLENMTEKQRNNKRFLNNLQQNKLLEQESVASDEEPTVESVESDQEPEVESVESDQEPGLEEASVASDEEPEVEEESVRSDGEPELEQYNSGVEGSAEESDEEDSINKEFINKSSVNKKSKKQNNEFQLDIGTEEVDNKSLINESNSPDEEVVDEEVIDEDANEEVVDEEVIDEDANEEVVDEEVIDEDTTEKTTSSLSKKSNSFNNSNLGEIDFKGGTTSSEILNVFIYNGLTLADLNKLLTKELTIESAELKGYYRAFDKDYSSIIKQKGTSVRGFVININQQDLDLITKKMIGYTIVNVDIVNNQGIIINHVIAYQKNINKWTVVPNSTIFKKIYSIVSEAWRDIDKLDKLYIYNNEYELMGYFDGKKYIDQEDDVDQPMINLGHPSPFLKKLQEREPTLFIKEDSQAFSQYSKLCPWNIRRYPIILTKEEKDSIDREAPGSYHSSIEYGTDPKKKYYYICPQYWNLKTNKPVRKEDVDPSVVIGPKETKPDLKKKYIFEFSTPSKGHHGLPSFLDKKSHPQGHFIPCCFKLNKIGEIPQAQLKRIEEAAKYMAKIEANTLNSASANKNKANVSDYIQNGLKFPLPPDRKGELPVTLENFFNFNHTTCYSNVKTKKFKINSPCLFRKGVISNKNQSFLEVIAAIYFDNDISKLKKSIVSVINIDNIQDFHNGNLSHTFSSDTYFEQDISKYETSELYLKMKDNIEGFKKIANGLERFYNYILDNDVYIDYTYLWDIICSGILTESKKPINMIILNETMDDVTQNINIICPTTVHSKFVFNLNNKTIFIYKKGDYYEPLLIYKESEKRIYDNIFEIDIKVKYPFLKPIIEAINTSLGECNGTIINKYYTFIKNISLIELITEIKKLELYSIKTQIMNYDGKIIALIVIYTNGSKVRQFYVPCAPSNKSNEIDNYEVINDTYWNSYPVTVKYLNKLYLDSEKRIPCLPKMRVIDKALIIGILTITNQFIMLKRPEENKYHDNLIDLNEHHYIHSSNEDYVNYDFVLKNNKLTKEQDVISYLKLEQQFYNAYFNTLKVLISDIKNLQIRKQIEDILKNAELPYTDQYTKIEILIKPLLSNFEYIDYSPEILKEIVEINICKNNIDKYCKEDGTLLLPKINLFNKENNEEAYLNKFIDNLIRNHNIQVSIFQDKHSTIYYTDDYNLSENEILLLESSLFPYLDSLGEIIKKNKYIGFRGLEDLTPQEIFQLLERDEPEKKANTSIKLSYNTNNNSSPKIDLFGIEPGEEVETILKDVKQNSSDEEYDSEKFGEEESDNNESNDEDQVKGESGEEDSDDESGEEDSDEENSDEEDSGEEDYEIEDQSVEAVNNNSDKKDSSKKDKVKQNQLEQEGSEQEGSDKEPNENKSNSKLTKKSKQLSKQNSSENVFAKLEESNNSLKKQNTSANEDSANEDSANEESVNEDSANEQSANEESVNETSAKNQSIESKLAIPIKGSTPIREATPTKGSKIKLNSTSCKLETLTTDIIRERLNNGVHKCLYELPITPEWRQHYPFKLQTTKWLHFGFDEKHKFKELPDPPNDECSYFLLSLILKDCNKEEYKGVYSSNYKEVIKKLLIEGYKHLITDNNLGKLINKWKKNGKVKESGNLIQINKKFKENITTIISQPDYKLTVIDFIIFMFYHNIPMVLMFQSTKTNTFSGKKLCSKQDSPYYYLIRVQKKMCSDDKKYNHFSIHLWRNGKNSKDKISTIRYSIYNNNQINSTLLQIIKENYYTFEEYLDSKELY